MKNSMKKIIALMLTLIMVLSIGTVATFAEEAPAETPTIANPQDPKIEPDTEGFVPVRTEVIDGKELQVWEIWDAADLLEFLNESRRNTTDASKSDNGLINNKKNYQNSIVRLMADIDLNPSWDATTKTTPQNYLSKSLFYMKCTFDGQGHTIRGLCVIVEGSDNANMVILSEGGTTFTNLKIENSYFSTRPTVKDGKVSGGNAAGIVAGARYGVWFKTVYVDAVVEAKNGKAGGFVANFSANGATLTPLVNIIDGVFAGEVSGTTAAGGFVGSNDITTANIPKGTCPITLTDCANYGKIVSTTPDTAGGLVGTLANQGKFIRCYNAGDVGTAFFNIIKSTKDNSGAAAITAEVIDCYYATAPGVVPTTATADNVTTLTYKYADADATEAKTATVAELVALDAFKKTAEFAGWTVAKDMAMSAAAGCLITSHNFVAGTPVPADKCIADGYTTNTCDKCYATTITDIVAKADHTYVESKVEPTCTEKGYTQKVCSICNDTQIVADSEVDAKGHTEGEWVVDKEPTTEYSGMKHQECSVCKASLATEILPKLTSTEEETDAPETNAPETTAPETTEAPAEGGCGSSIAIGGMVLMSTVLSLGVATVSKKRK